MNPLHVTLLLLFIHSQLAPAVSGQQFVESQVQSVSTLHERIFSGVWIGIVVVEVVDVTVVPIVTGVIHKFFSTNFRKIQKPTSMTITTKSM
jgi:hypothetical protein